MPITAVYAGLLGLVFIVLSARVIGQRRGAKVSLGDGGNAVLLRRMRVHGNFAEYVPLALVLLGLAESLGAPAWLLHTAGAGLLAGRLSHAFGVSQTPERFLFRVSGMAATLTVLGLLSAICLYLGIAP
jgi:hypothetical protein